MKKLSLWILMISLMLLIGCTEQEEVIVIEDLDIPFTGTLGEKIPVQSISIPFSVVKGNQDNFIHYDKPVDINPLLFIKSSIKTHQVIFAMDAIYPIDVIDIVNHPEYQVESMSIDVSIDGVQFKRFFTDYPLADSKTTISLGEHMARAVKLTFKANETVGLQDVSFKLGNGVIVTEAKEWSDTFLRYDGWTGADGIFTFDLTHGKDTITTSKNVIGFIFSDTFVGKVNEFNKLRLSPRMINNSLGYYDPNKPFGEAFSFDYVMNDGLAYSPFLPDAYIGKKARNLMDGDGLSVTQSKDAMLSSSSDGIGWLSNQIGAYVTIDFKSTQSLDMIYVWNYAAESTYGTKTFQLETSLDGHDFSAYGTFHMDQVILQDEHPYTLAIALEGTQARYLRIRTLESYHETYVGLGKVMAFAESGSFLFGEATDSDHVNEKHPNEFSSRLWLQDGIVLDGYLYTFPILVKDYLNYFMVHNVGMIKTPIRNDKIIHQESIYLQTPLQVRTDDGGILYYGAGVMHHVDEDGYIYIYGYKDLAGRHLISARVRRDHFEDFNRWEYYNGSGYGSDITQSSPIISGVSAELSVTYMKEGMFAGKYMLVVMENTTSGKISYALSDTPYGPFQPYVQVFQTQEHLTLRGAFTYNAKLHPNLSEPGHYLISYNVNTTQLGALSDARIYYPRFIRLIEVKQPKE